MNLQWLYRRIISEEELTPLLPVMIQIDQDKLPEFLNLIRKNAARRKIIKKITFGKFPEKLYKTRKRNRFSQWIIRKFLR